MHTNPIKFAGVVVLILCLGLAGCSSSAIKDLQLVVAGSEAVVAALESSGTIPAPISAAINVYMGQVSDFVTFATTELASSESSAVKISKIAAEAAGLSKPDLPPGVPSLVATAVQAVAVSLATFIGNLHATAAVLSESSYGNSFLAGSKPAKLKLSAKDKAELEKLHARALALKARFPKK